MSDDKPYRPKLWTNAARKIRPDLAWAIDEIDPCAGIDTLCVELESITGVSAYQMRTDLLLRFAHHVRNSNKWVYETVELIKNTDRRIAMWVARTCLHTALVTALASGENMDVVCGDGRTVESHVVSVLPFTKLWCSGDMSAAPAGAVAGDLAFEAHDSLAMYSRSAWILWPASSLGQTMRRNDEWFRTLNGPEFVAVKCVEHEGGIDRFSEERRIAEERYDEVIFEAILSLPVWEPR